MRYAICKLRHHLPPREDVIVTECKPSIERWFFYQDVASLWKWARLDVFGTVLDYSACAISTRDDCLDDARRSGYLPQAPFAARVSGRASIGKARTSRSTRSRRSPRPHSTRL
jgi:hypothetical protein